MSAMQRARGFLWFLFALVAGACGPAAAQSGGGDAKKGEYLAKAAGCNGCHTAETQGAARFAGGRALLTPFGTFYGPNITPHPSAGIGNWSEADLRRALRLGERPDGAHYFPSFPYVAFTGMSDADIRDLWAYLRTVPSSDRKNREHELRFPFNIRAAVGGWKALYFTPGPAAPDPRLSAVLNRGAYLTNTLGHCGECHTPRNAAGGLRKDRLLGGGETPEGKVPNITPTRLGKWSDAQLRAFLREGVTPEGDATSDAMYEVIRNTTSQLTADDLAALMAYLRSVPPLPEEKK